MKNVEPAYTPHLAPAAIAILLLMAVVTWFARHASNIERRNIHALAPDWFQQKTQGIALQTLAFRERDILPVYGSSELGVQSVSQRPYQPAELFRSSPTGFTVFSVFEGGLTTLITLQKISAVGDAAKGGKVVISMAPGWFQKPMADLEYYAGNFSRLHALETLFSTRLDFTTRHDIAIRMLDYPKTIEDAPVIAFALARLAGNSTGDRALLLAAFPLGKLQAASFRLQDHWQTLDYIRKNPSASPQHTGRGLDWAELRARAGSEKKVYATNNPFGFDDEFWNAKKDILLKHDTSRGYLDRENKSKEWIDFELLLRVLGQSGAKTFVIVPPRSAGFLAHIGVEDHALASFYPRIRELCRKNGAPVLDFAETEKSGWLVIDAYGHPSPVCLVDLAKAMDDFYHDRAPGRAGN